jgi:ribosome-binding protein aMBF1 (putative translation factor)
MSAHTRTHPTKIDSQPSPNMSKNESIPWREGLDLKEGEEIGIVLSGCRYRENMTQKELADKLGVKQHHISEMEHGKRSIGKKLAHRLAKILNTDYKTFL